MWVHYVQGTSNRWKESLNFSETESLRKSKVWHESGVLGKGKKSPAEPILEFPVSSSSWKEAPSILTVKEQNVIVCGMYRADFPLFVPVFTCPHIPCPPRQLQPFHCVSYEQVLETEKPVDLHGSIFWVLALAWSRMVHLSWRLPSFAERVLSSLCPPLLRHFRKWAVGQWMCICQMNKTASKGWIFPRWAGLA